MILIEIEVDCTGFERFLHFVCPIYDNSYLVTPKTVQQQSDGEPLE